MTKNETYLHIAIPALVSGFILAIIPSLNYVIAFIISAILYISLLLVIKKTINEHRGNKKEEFINEFLRRFESIIKEYEEEVKKQKDRKAQQEYQSNTDKNRQSKNSDFNNSERNNSYNYDNKSSEQVKPEYKKVETIEEAFMILGINIIASQRDIQQAFYKLIFLNHPDRNSTKDKAEQELYILKTKQIIEARDFIYRYRGFSK